MSQQIHILHYITYIIAFDYLGNFLGGTGMYNVYSGHTVINFGKTNEKLGFAVEKCKCGFYFSGQCKAVWAKTGYNTV